MAYEVKDWKASDCSLTLKTSALSNRESSSGEINETYGEGGGLNANYTTVEAIAIVANILGAEHGFRYGVHFVFKTGGFDEISFDFFDQATRDVAEGTLFVIGQIA